MVTRWTPRAREPVQVERLHGDERLSLTGLHLGDIALVQRDSAHQLDVEQPHAERALECLAHRRVRLEEQVFQRLAVLEALLELRRLGRELLVGERLELRFERADVGRLILESLEATPLPHAENALEPAADALGRHRSLGYRLGWPFSPRASSVAVTEWTPDRHPTATGQW